jgi:hypothetical protein
MSVLKLTIPHDKSVPAQLAEIEALLAAGHSEAAVRMALETYAADTLAEALRDVAKAIRKRR